MKVIIVEDETTAANNLKHVLNQVDSSIEILEVIDSVEQAVEWFENNEAPELIFMDIHLADADAFKIFDRVTVLSPIIFTTAYDQYALDAFKVNSIDYVLKPVSVKEIDRALSKFKHLTSIEASEYISNQNQLNKPSQSAFLIPIRERLVPLHIDEVAFFYSTNEHVRVYTLESRNYPIDKSLDALSKLISENDFFRVNRQFIVARQSITDMVVWSGSRLKVNTNIKTPEDIIVSKARVAEFKRWIKS